MPSLIFPVTLWPGTTCAPADIQFNLIWSSSVGAAYIFRDLGQWEASKLRKSSFVTSQRISLHQQNAMAEKPCNHGGSPLTSHVTSSFSLWLKINLVVRIQTIYNYVFRINLSKRFGNHENMKWVVTKLCRCMLHLVDWLYGTSHCIVISAFGAHWNWLERLKEGNFCYKSTYESTKRDNSIFWVGFACLWDKTKKNLNFL